MGDVRVSAPSTKSDEQEFCRLEPPPASIIISLRRIAERSISGPDPWVARRPIKMTCVRSCAL